MPIILILFIAVINAILAGQRNRSKFWWFIWGLLFSFLSTILLLVLGEKE